MKREDLFNAITNIRDSQVEGAKPRPRLRPWLAVPVAAALAICLAVAAVTGFPQPQTLRSGTRLAAAVYPAINDEKYEESTRSTGPYDEQDKEPEEDSTGLQAFWENHAQAQTEYAGMRAEYANQLESFWLDCAQTFLSQEDLPLAQQVLGENENRIISPVELYLTLGMSAEITTGLARQEILDLLGSPDIEHLRASANRIWNASYVQEEDHALLHASSIWLRDDTAYHQEVLDILAQNYYADSFSGEMGSEAYNALRRDWIDEKTNGFLADVLKEPEAAAMSASTNMALTSATYFKSRWLQGFHAGDHTEMVFHARQGDLECTFMRQTLDSGTYYHGDSFGAVSKDLCGGTRMLFLLPDEAASTDELLADSQCRDFMAYFIKQSESFAATGDLNPCEEKKLEIRLAVPKFDIISQMDLAEGLQQMGVRTAFEYGSRSFTPITERESTFTSIPQTCRFQIEEDTVEPAPFIGEDTSMGAASPPDCINFVLDRPFLFLLVSGQGLPIYIGVVNQP